MKKTGVITGIALAMILAGCQNKSQGVFSAQQIEVMRSQGFSEVPEGWMLGMSDNILFGMNRAELQPQSIQKIKVLASKLSGFGLKHARLDGHSDNYGDDNYNKALSLKRANVVADAWAEGAGVSRSNISTQGLGDEDPVKSNKTSQGRAENRRVAIIITAP
ncbi:hypothetical protein BSU01_22605 [Erwinia billingiae]|uniref:OmpA family protein n=1 Tax=Erwinia billingiae TaxID=182337 RepID=UPI0019D1AE8E|nr:OmpA family protein [Erwinia billingiae]MBN7124481.1 hypothetical protein [Erwinia billingiae]